MDYDNVANCFTWKNCIALCICSTTVLLPVGMGHFAAQAETRTNPPHHLTVIEFVVIKSPDTRQQHQTTKKKEGDKEQQQQ